MSSRSDVSGALAWLALAIFVCMTAARLGLGGVSQPGPGFIFFGSGIILAVLAVTLLLRSLGTRHDGGSAVHAHHWGKIALGAAALFVYVLVFESSGFLLSTVAVMAVMARLNEERRWKHIGAFAIGSTAGAYLILQVWLGLRLPELFR